MKKPNFLIVGAPKCGTTSIAHYLNEHPDIFISEEKEPFYFLSELISSISKDDPVLPAIEKRAHLTSDKYYGLFDKVTTEKKIGEATVHYLYHYDTVIPRIKEELGDVQIIIALRNPSPRAYSNYSFLNDVEFNSFEKSLELEEERKKRGFNSLWFYKSVGKYYQPVKEYHSHFSDVHVCFFEDLKKDPRQFMSDIYSFLGVDYGFVPNVKEKHNRTIIPNNKFIHYLNYLKHKIKREYNIGFKTPESLKEKLFRDKKSEINPETLVYLISYFKDDIMNLENLLGKNLSKWYK